MKLSISSKLLALAIALTFPLALRAGRVATTLGAPSESGNVQVVDVSSKADVDIDQLVQKGNTTIVDVFSEACPPCRQLSPKLDELAAKKAGLKVLKLDIGTKQLEEGRGINWGAPMIAKYEIHGIPYLFLYSEDGKLKSKGDDAYEEILSWLKATKIIPGK